MVSYCSRCMLRKSVCYAAGGAKCPHVKVAASANHASANRKANTAKTHLKYLLSECCRN